MPLFNLAWASSYTWDGRRSRVRDQVLSPIQDAKEMHQALPQALRKLAADATYPAQFARAFGSKGVTAERLGLAVEQYLLTIISADSKFDRALRQEATFTDEEKQGLFLFITEYNPARDQHGADCFHCHGGNLFTDYQFKNNGVYDAYDWGRSLVTNRAVDRGKFKTPSLRNVELTGPYMHDGQFKTLEEVVEHYNSGVHRSDTLDPNLAKHPDNGLQLSTADKKALVAFLKTLTDERFRTAKASPP
jgi:cytochrome c peroxidase